MYKRPPSRLLLITGLLSLPLFLPFLYVVVRAYDVGIERAISLLFRPRMAELLGNTIFLMVAVTLLAVVLGTLCAFLIERYRFRGRAFFDTAMTLPLCIPAFISAFGWISLTFRIEGVVGAIMVMTLNSIPLAYLPVSAALKRLDYTLEEVSLSLGKNHRQTFWSAVFPQIKPAIGSSVLLIALHMLIEFGAVSVLNYQTFTTAIFQEYEMAFNNSTAALLSAVLMLICFLVVMGESHFRGTEKLYRSAKGTSRPYPLKPLQGVQQIPLWLLFGTIFTLGVGVPIGTLSYWLVSGYSEANYAGMFEAFFNSFTISSLGALLTVVAALPLVWLAVRYPHPITRFLDRLPYLLHAVPGLVIALSLIYFSINYAKPIYQTFVVVVIAYFMLYLPMAQTALHTSLAQLPETMEKIGYSLGRKPSYIFRTLTIPMLLPGLTAAFALVFLNLMKELTATLLLTPSDLRTLSVAVWDYTTEAEYAAAAPYAAMIILCSGIPVYLLKKYAFK